MLAPPGRTIDRQDHERYKTDLLGGKNLTPLYLQITKSSIP
jgi:hypothetical protein